MNFRSALFGFFPLKISAYYAEAAFFLVNIDFFAWMWKTVLDANLILFDEFGKIWSSKIIGFYVGH